MGKTDPVHTPFPGFTSTGTLQLGHPLPSWPPAGQRVSRETGPALVGSSYRLIPTLTGARRGEAGAPQTYRDPRPTRPFWESLA